MTGDEMKKMWTTATRNNELELKAEIQRCRDKMAMYEPGTQEYADVLKAYDILLSQEKELKKLHEDASKIIWGAAFTVGGWILYRGLIDKSADPFFREIGKNLIKLIHA